MNRIDGKNAVVTGGTQGLGAAIARTFADAGAANLTICGRNVANGARVASDIANATGARFTLSRLILRLSRIAEKSLQKQASSVARSIFW